MKNKIYYVYAINSSFGARIYVGMSYHPQQRLHEHNAGEVKSTKRHRPWSMFYCKQVGSRINARLEENRLKSGYGKEFLKKNIPG